MFITPVKDEEQYVEEEYIVIWLSDLLQPFGELYPYLYLHRCFLKNIGPLLRVHFRLQVYDSALFLIGGSTQFDFHPRKTSSLALVVDWHL